MTIVGWLQLSALGAALLGYLYFGHRMFEGRLPEADHQQRRLAYNRWNLAFNPHLLTTTGRQARRYHLWSGGALLVLLIGSLLAGVSQ